MVVSSVALFTSYQLGRFNENNPYLTRVTTLIVTKNFLHIDLYMGLGLGQLLSIIDIQGSFLDKIMASESKFHISEDKYGL
jgi:hypothetical protein